MKLFSAACLLVVALTDQALGVSPNCADSDQVGDGKPYADLDACLDAYNTDQLALANDLRVCPTTEELGLAYPSDGFTGFGEFVVPDAVASYARVRINLPKSGWAMKRFPGVKAWLKESYDAGHWDKNLVIVSRISTQSLPEIVYYDVQPRVCKLTKSDSSTLEFDIDEEDDATDDRRENGSTPVSIDANS